MSLQEGKTTPAPFESAELRNAWVGTKEGKLFLCSYYQGHEWTTPDPKKRWVRSQNLSTGEIELDQFVTYDPLDVRGESNARPFDKTAGIVTLVPADTRFWNAGCYGEFGVVHRPQSGAHPASLSEIKRATPIGLVTELALAPRESIEFFDGQSAVATRRAGGNVTAETISIQTKARKAIAIPAETKQLISNGEAHIAFGPNGAIAVDDGGTVLWKDPGLKYGAVVPECIARRSNFVVTTADGFEIRSFRTNEALAARHCEARRIRASCADEISAVWCPRDESEPDMMKRRPGQAFVFRDRNELWAGDSKDSPRVLRSGARPIVSGDDWMLNAASAERLPVAGRAILCAGKYIIAVDQASGLRAITMPGSWQ